MTCKNDQERLALARRIIGAGIPIYIRQDDPDVPHDPSNGLLIYQEGGLIESRAFDYYGVAAYVIRVVITVHFSRFAIASFGLELPWKGSVQWLDDPRDMGRPSDAYRFAGNNVLEFERHEVLNHYADVRRIWSRGASLKGYLLGIGDAPIPVQFLNGATLPALLTVYDQFWQPYETSVSLFTERAEKCVRLNRSRTSRRVPLFSQRDRVLNTLH